MQRQWNRHNPQQMLAVFIAVLRHDPKLANDFRRALHMQDAPTAKKDERRIVLPGEGRFPRGIN
jgi:hypothetical protein